MRLGDVAVSGFILHRERGAREGWFLGAPFGSRQFQVGRFQTWRLERAARKLARLRRPRSCNMENTYPCRYCGKAGAEPFGVARTGPEKGAVVYGCPEGCKSKESTCKDHACPNESANCESPCRDPACNEKGDA